MSCDDYILGASFDGRETRRTTRRRRLVASAYKTLDGGGRDPRGLLDTVSIVREGTLPLVLVLVLVCPMSLD